jgi:hypothetical protein
LYGWELKFCSSEVARQRNRQTISPKNLHAKFHAASSSHALVTAANLTNIASTPYRYFYRDITSTKGKYFSDILLFNITSEALKQTAPVSNIKVYKHYAHKNPTSLFKTCVIFFMCTFLVLYYI